MSRFVRPDTKILKISNGDTLTVKCRLNSGEQRAAFARMAVAGVDGEMRVNAMQVGLSLVVAYLVDWSLTDEDGNVVEIRDQPPETVTAALDALDVESYTEIKNAIEEHDEAVRAARDEAKKNRDSGNGSLAISTSPALVTGESNGLLN